MNRYYIIFYLLSLLIFIPGATQAQWVRQYPLAKMEHVVDIAIHQDGHGYAVGADDLILRLDPGTKRWDLLSSWNNNWILESVDYLEGTSGQVVAAGGQGLIVSTNAGQNWSEIAGAPGGILALKILSATDIVVVADGGVHRWHNNTWEDLDLPVTSGVDGGYIHDAQHIWCFTTGATPRIYSTTNGGGVWNTSSTVARPDAIKFFDTTYGIAFDGREVWKSQNSGMTWELVSDNIIHNSVNDFTFGSSPNIMMAATLNGIPSISTDGGLTWAQKDMELINERNYSIAARNDMEFWVGNDLSSVTLTTDAGTNWIETSGPSRNLLYDVWFLNRNFGFSVGTGGTLLRTTNGGSQWEDKSFGESRTFWTVNGTSANDVWIGASQRIYHSADMGETWQEKLSTLGANYVDILAVNANLILACSSSGIILRSTDAGANWDTTFQTNGQIRSLAKIDNQRFFATGFNGLLLRSNDQGATWTPLSAPEAGLQYEQTHFIGDQGWLVTSSFKKTMWHTANAGDTWTPITLPIERFWDGVYFISPDTGIVVGRSTGEGRAYITFNGGVNWQSGYITDFALYGVSGLPSPNGTAWIHGFGSDIETLPYCDLLPVIADLTGENSPCENDTVTYSISSQGVDQFSWLFPSGWQILGVANNDTIQVKVGRNAGTISVTGSNACGFSSPLSMGAGPILLPVVDDISGDNSPCEGEIIGYSVTATSINDFAWSFPGPDWEIFGQPNSDEIQVYVGETAGTISVTGTNTCGSSVTDLAVTPELRPRMYSVSGPATPCEGDVVQYVADGEYYDEVVWNYPADWQVIGASNTATIELKAGAIAGLITAAGVNPCGTSAVPEALVTPFDVPDASVTVNGDVLSLSHDATTYQWYLNGEIIPGATTAQYTATVSGDYYAILVFDNGCSATTPTINHIITSIGQSPDVEAINIYPNPVSDQLHIRDLTGQVPYSITNLAGSTVLSGVMNDHVISVLSLPEGVYMLRMQQDEKVFGARFVVKRN
jgi:photosystem II stability/assembly factor-like uncharacterized protein